MLQAHANVPDRRLEHASAPERKAETGRRRQSAALVAREEAGPLGFAACLCIGAALYMQLPFEPAAGQVFGLAAFVLLAMLALRRLPGPPFARWAMLAVFGLAAGLAAGKARVLASDSTTLAAPLGPVMVEGWVTLVEPGTNGTRLRLRPHAIAGVAPDALPDRIRLTHRLSLNVSPGRFVRCYGVLRPPPGPAVPGDYDFRRQAWFEGLGAVGYVQGRCRGGTLGAPPGLAQRLGLGLSALRRQLAVFTRDAAGERAGGFAAALVTGDRSFMTQPDQEALRASGLAHLLAISGLHLGIVGGLVYLLVRRGLALVEPLSLRFPVQKAAAAAALVAIALYLVLSGASVSTQRAFIMSSVFFSAILIDRPALSLRSFSIALVAVVVLRPESVVSPGFQMSFAATGVLIAIYQAWSVAGRPPSRGLLGRLRLGASSLAVTSIAASAATGPFAIFHFERVAPWGLLANLAAMPVVSLAAVPAAAVAMLLAPFGLSEIGLRLFGFALEAVLLIAHRAAAAGTGLDYPLPPMPGAALGLFSAMVAVFILFRGWLRIAATCGTFLLGAALWAVLPQPDAVWSPSGEAYLNLAGEGWTRLALVDADALGPLRFAGAGDWPACAEAECTYRLDESRTVLVRMPQAPKDACAAFAAHALVLDASPGPHGEPCPNVLSWDRIRDRGGASITLARDGRIELRHPPACGVRPWHPCPPIRSGV